MHVCIVYISGNATSATAPMTATISTISGAISTGSEPVHNGSMAHESTNAEESTSAGLSTGQFHPQMFLLLYLRKQSCVFASTASRGRSGSIDHRDFLLCFVVLLLFRSAQSFTLFCFTTSCTTNPQQTELRV